MRNAVVVVGCALVLVLGAWCSQAPRVPPGLGYCVSVYDRSGALVGVEQVPLHRPDPEKLDELRGSLRNAVWYVGQRAGRQDVVLASAEVVLVDDPVAYQSGKDGCVTACGCASPIYCSTAAREPSTSMRQAPGDRGGRSVCGCGGACGPCEKCVVVCSGPR